MFDFNLVCYGITRWFEQGIYKSIPLFLLEDLMEYPQTSPSQRENLNKIEYPKKILVEEYEVAFLNQ